MGEVLPINVASPAYTAVIECCPLASDEVLNVALPPLSVPMPSVVVPSLNVTFPVGVPRVAGFTVAVNVTAVPKVDGFNEDVTDVELACVCAGLGITSTTASSDGLGCVGLQLLHLVWKPLTTVAGLVWPKKLSESVRP